jgi:hypothetical protein
MKTLERVVLIAAVLCVVVVAFAQTYLKGESAGRRQSERYWTAHVQERVESQVKDTRRVMGIREHSAYQRGFTACQEQF